MGRTHSTGRARAALTLTLMLAGVVAALACKASGDATSGGATASTADCKGLPGGDDLSPLLRAAPDSGEAGGMFHGRAEWAVVVNRQGQFCALVPPSDSGAGYWPASRSLAMAKAYTANGFSTDTLPVSSARLYTLTQPGHSLWGVSQALPFSPAHCIHPYNAIGLCGGTIAFGGGVPLYRGGRVIGALGVSGDTPCADHEIAKRVRHFAGLDPRGGPAADDIQYSKVDGASIYTHPLCANTWRNGQRIGDEPPASGY